MKKKFRSSDVAAISIAHLFHDVYAAFFAPLLPLLITKLGISLSMAGILDFVRKSPSLINPLIGYIADRGPFRYFVIVTPAVTAVAMSLIGTAPNIGILMMLLFTAGLSSTFFHIPTPVMMKTVSGDRIGTGMSFYMLGGELSRTFGPLIVTAAISLWGMEGTWRLMPFGIVCSAVLFFKLRNIKLEKGNKAVRDKIRIREAFNKHSRMFFIVSMFLFFRTAMKSALTLFLPTYLTFQGRSLWSANISLSVLQLSGAAGVLCAGMISDRIGRKNTLLISSLVSPVLMWLFISSDSLYTLPILSLAGFFLFAPGPVLLAIVQDNDSDRPALINSIYMTVSFFVTSLIIYFVGLGMDHIGFELTYRISIFMAVVSVVFVLKMPEKTLSNELLEKL